MQICFKSRIEYLENLKLHYVIVTDDFLQKFWEESDTGSLYNQRFIITINDRVTWRGGTVSLGNQKAYIAFSKARMKEIGVSNGDTVAVCLEKDRSLYGFEVPEEFEEVLRQDAEARQRFEKLAMGMRRAIIYIVLQIKSSDKRIEKSIFLLENLKRAPKDRITMRHVLGKDLP